MRPYDINYQSGSRKYLALFDGAVSIQLTLRGFVVKDADTCSTNIEIDKSV